MGQIISFLGTMVSYVAIPYQIYQITQSSLMVGMLGVVQLIPVLVFGLIGGSVADSMNRKKLIVVSELIMMLSALILFLNAFLESSNVLIIFIAAALMQSANGFHRPAMEAMTQKIVDASDYPSVAALNAFKRSFASVAGPAFGGILIAGFGIKTAYAFDFLTYLCSLVFLFLINKMPTPEKAPTAGIKSILEGLKFAVKKPELMGTYIVDIVAMVFAYPTALFPSLGQAFGGAKHTGLLYSAMSLGSLAMTLLSGWTSKVKYHGRGVVISAVLWGAAIMGLGFSNHFYIAVIFLVFAGALDMSSGLFRGVIWNQSVPNSMRGRLAGIEMISYMTGPLIGNARAGYLANQFGNEFSITSGGLLCVCAVILCAILLPQFWNYKSTH